MSCISAADSLRAASIAGIRGLERLVGRHLRRPLRALLAKPGQVAVEHAQEQRLLARRPTRRSCAASSAGGGELGDRDFADPRRGRSSRVRLSSSCWRAASPGSGRVDPLRPAALARSLRDAASSSRFLRLELRQQRRRHFDAIGGGAPGQFDPPRPGSRTSGSSSMVATSVSMRSWNTSLPPTASGSITTNAWPMCGRLPASVKNESASKPNAAPVSAQQISSTISASIAPLIPTGRQHHAGEPGLRVGGWIAVPVERPAGGNRLALARRHHQLAARNLGQRQVDRQRRRVAPQRPRRSGWCRRLRACLPTRTSLLVNRRTPARPFRRRRPVRDATPRRRNGGCG